MVVLEEGGMPTNGNNQYLQPDYLSPLPTMLDAKKSPLAMLVQTCSQIGADSPTKSLILPLEKASKTVSGNNGRSPPAAKLDRGYSSPSEPKPLGFKPYESNVTSKKCSIDENRPTSKTSVHSASLGNQDCGMSLCDNNNSDNNKTTENFTRYGRKSASPNNNQNRSCNGSNTILENNRGSSDERTTPRCSFDREKTNESPSRTTSDASPTVRTGLDMLTSGGGGGGVHQKDFGAYKTTSGFGGFNGGNPMCCPPGMSENPAFRPPFAGGASPFSHHHAAAAAALLGYPTATPTTGSLYLSYARVKTPSGGEALVPVCKDPYCTGCQYSMHNAQMMMGAGSCPSGCTQCDHQKYGLAMALSSLAPMPPPSMSYPSLPTAGGRPYVCNWIVGDTYCGKRFNTSEELLQHLRSHTSIASGVAAVTNDNGGSTFGGTHQQQQQQQHPLLSPSAAIHRAAAAAAAAASSYPPPSLSPLGGRYHPYGKPPTGPMPASLAASPYSAFNTLGPYYSPYAIYGQRLGAAAVHP